MSFHIKFNCHSMVHLKKTKNYGSVSIHKLPKKQFLQLESGLQNKKLKKGVFGDIQILILSLFQHHLPISFLDYAAVHHYLSSLVCLPSFPTISPWLPVSAFPTVSSTFIFGVLCNISSSTLPMFFNVGSSLASVIT